MSVLAIIPAKGQSEGLPGKNYMTLLGKSVLAHLADELYASRVDQAIVSTDCQHVASAARDAGMKVAMRPGTGMQEWTSSEVVRWHVRQLEVMPEVVLEVYASAVRPFGLLDRCAQSARDVGSSFAICRAGHHHPRLAVARENGRIRFAYGTPPHKRQDLDECYYICGGVFGIRSDVLLNARPSQDPHWMFGPSRAGVVVGPYEVAELDDPADVSFAEFVLRNRQCGR